MQKLYYAFVDSLVIPGPHFYRLKQMDYNGDHAYSKIVKCNPQTGTGNYWELRKNEIFIVDAGIVSAYFKLFNSKGVLVAAKEVFWGDSFYLGGRMSGIYYIQMDEQLPVKCFLD